jgi:hypothetical protein
MSGLVRYEAARRALSEARQVDEVLKVRSDADRMKLYARQAKDRDLMADAVEIRLRAERQLGILIRAAKEAGQIAEGRKRKPENCSDEEQFPRVTLEEAGIDRKLSSEAQKRASISEQAFENVVRATRDRILSDRAKIIEAPLAHGASRVQGAADLDYSPTPPWATRALFEHVLPHLGVMPIDRVWEPACGEGHIAEVCAEYCRHVAASDIHAHGYSDDIFDFLAGPCDPNDADWIITNPPFEDRVLKFMLRALALARVGVAMFVQLRYLEGVERYNQLFSANPPTLIAPFVERVPLVMGRYDPDASTTTAFMWLVWVKGHAPQAPFWIPPGQRKALTRDGDRERFTAHPVTRMSRAVACDEQFDCQTGEIEEPEAQHGDTDLNSASVPSGDEPRASLEASCSHDAGAVQDRCESTAPPLSVDDDPLDIPAFLRREAAE